MPFDFDSYQSKCDGLTTEQLHREWENYTRQISGAATSTATAVLFSPLTAGISLVGLGLSAPRIHNARKKRQIIEAKLQTHGQTHVTRKRDVIAPVAVSGTIGGLTLGLAGPGADMIAGEAVGHGMGYAASHVALDATGAVVEHKHTNHEKTKADQKMNSQYQNFQTQFVQQHAAQGVYLQPQGENPNVPVQQQQQIAQAPTQGLATVGVQAYQPLPPSQDQKYEYVPIPVQHNPTISYRPVSYQNFAPPGPQTPTSPYQQLPPYSPLQQTGPPGAVSALSIQGASRINGQPYCQPPVSNIQHYNSPSLTPLPVHSVSPNLSSAPGPEWQAQPISPISNGVVATNRSAEEPFSLASAPKYVVSPPPADVFELPAELVSAAVPQSDSPLPVASMDEEILLLKARILQMEIEKRGGVIDIVPAKQESSHSSPVSLDIQDRSQDTSLSSIDIEGAVEPSPQTKLATVSSNDGLQQKPAVTLVRPGTEKQNTQQSNISLESNVEKLYEFEPLAFYPPPPASPAPPPSLLPSIPLLKSLPYVSAIQVPARDSAARPLHNILPPISAHPTSPTPLQTRHTVSSPDPVQLVQPRPLLPPRPKSQVFDARQFQSPTYETSPTASQYLAPSQQQYTPTQAPATQSTYQNQQVTPQNIAMPVTYAQPSYPPPPPSPRPQQQYQAPASQPHSVFQPSLSPQQYQAAAPRPQSVYQPSPPPQQYHEPASRPQSVYQPSPAAPAQAGAPPTPQQIQGGYRPLQFSPPQQSQPETTPRPQSMYQTQYAPPSQPSASTQQQQQPQQKYYRPPPPPSQYVPQAPPQPCPTSTYQPLSFSSPPSQHQQIYTAPDSKPTPINRQDSGYYSTTSLSPQSTGLVSPQQTPGLYHGRSGSISTMGATSPSPNTPYQTPQVYFPPPPSGSAPSAGRGDYFNQKAPGPAPPQSAQGYNPGAIQTQQSAAQNWQQTVPAPYAVQAGQPDYGAPLPVPQAWK